MKAALVTGRRKPLKRTVVPAAAGKSQGQTGALKRFVTACLVLSLGVILAYHFFLFWTTGQVLIEEPNKLVLALESIMSLGIIAFGLEQLVRI
jgi:hypothetical protein